LNQVSICMNIDNYLPIDGQTVTIDSIKSFDVFFQSDGKMSLFAASGGAITEEAREKTSATGIDQLFILKRDLGFYTMYIEEVLGTILREPLIAPETKARTAYHSISHAARNLFAQLDTKILKRYKHVVEEIVKYITSDPAAVKLLINLTNYEYSVSNHSVNVGIFSTALAKELLTEPHKHDFDALGVGFFLHDIGKTSIPLEILNKKGPLSNVDWRFVKRHPEEGLRILDENEMLTREASIIVGQHHERHNGSGYPRGLSGNAIHVYGQICAIADCFDGLTSKRPYRKEYTTFNALKIMKHEVFKDFNPLFFQTFIRLLSN
jgi:HD-GYP domain-containing protein (c-di-GMP phosphodiesterase class II)